MVPAPGRCASHRRLDQRNEPQNRRHQPSLVLDPGPYQEAFSIVHCQAFSVAVSRSHGSSTSVWLLGTVYVFQWQRTTGSTSLALSTVAFRPAKGRAFAEREPTMGLTVGAVGAERQVDHDVAAGTGAGGDGDLAAEEAARWRMPARPKHFSPTLCGSKPVPQSCTLIRTVSPCWVSSRRMLSLWLCWQALVRLSWAMR